MTAKDYLKVIERSDEDNCFIGSAPPLIGQCCNGKTETEVMKQLLVIVQEWIDLYNHDGKLFPAPKGGRYMLSF
jgi:predicted RNase H-like HicB family nuclease